MQVPLKLLPSVLIPFEENFIRSLSSSIKMSRRADITAAESARNWSVTILFSDRESAMVSARPSYIGGEDFTAELVRLPGRSGCGVCTPLPGIAATAGQLAVD
jgi:hypothetical protein